MPAPTEVQAATLDKFIAGWKEFTPESWMATWSEDCTQKMLPLSLGVPARSRSEVLEILPGLVDILKNYRLDIREIVHDSPRSKAVIYAISYADTSFGDLKWTNEYAVFVTFTEDGTKVKKIEEMVDSAFYQEFFPKFQQYMKEQGATSH
ncbi:Monooxygenase dmxR10 [Ciborinia camelliae]|nr:Monooxygenase dmxR10 [Ciborinia camelliae]